MNTLLNYPGAKWGMAKMIVSMMPKHRSYLEPFFGSGAVLFNKPPSAIETVNDIDGDTVHDFDRRFEMEDLLLVPADRTFRWAMLENLPKFVPWVGDQMTLF